MLRGWSNKGVAFPYPFAVNLPIIPRQDSEDDFLRLLFVALTRSKVNLFITSHLYDDKGKERQALPYLDFLDTNPVPDINYKDLTQGILKSIQPASLYKQVNFIFRGRSAKL